jgi:tRNA-dihydrouridine synthase
VPVTAKIRLGWDRRSRNFCEVARLLEENGASLIAVHGRTREDNYSVPADWDAIARVKQSVRIPVLGNGDVRTVADIARFRHHTKCDGIMIGRGAIGNPWIFQQRKLCDVSLEERFSIVRKHLEAMVRFYGERRGVLTFRKHIVRYIRGIPGASGLRVEVLRCVTVDEVLRHVESFLHATQNVL